jgi:hypothetical protein
MRNWIYKILLRSKQKKLLFEMEMDLKFLETYKSEVIKADEGELREALSVLNIKEDRTAEDNAQIEKIAGMIADLKVVRSRYAGTKSNIKEIKEYIAMLSL